MDSAQRSGDAFRRTMFRDPKLFMGEDHMTKLVRLSLKIVIQREPVKRTPAGHIRWVFIQHC